MTNSILKDRTNISLICACTRIPHTETDEVTPSTWQNGSHLCRQAAEASGGVGKRGTGGYYALFRKAGWIWGACKGVGVHEASNVDSKCKFTKSTAVCPNSRWQARSFLTSSPPRVSNMASSQQQKGRDGALSTLDVFIQALSLAKDTCGIPPAQIAFGSATVLLTMIRASSLFVELADC